MKNIILLAPPASGKGTQAVKLQDKYKLIHVSTGDILRQMSKEEDELGKKLKEIMTSGKLVSDDIVIKALEKKLNENLSSNGFIFDGFPRTVEQAQALDIMLNKLNLNIDNVFDIEVEYETLVKRITGRRSCPKCGSVYNIYEETLMPNEDNTCRKCNSQLILRSDDNEESFKLRFEEYNTKTKPLVDYYRNQDKLVLIDGNKDIELVFKDICKLMERDV